MLRAVLDAQNPGDPTLGPLLSSKILLFTGVCLGQAWVQPLLPTCTLGGGRGVARVRAMDLSNIQVFALSLPGAFVIVPNRVRPTHLWRKDRYVVIWASRGCCLSKERFGDPTAPAKSSPTLPKLPPLTEELREEDPTARNSLSMECSWFGRASTQRGPLLVHLGPGSLGGMAEASLQAIGQAGE